MQFKYSDNKSKRTIHFTRCTMLTHWNWIWNRKLALERIINSKSYERVRCSPSHSDVNKDIKITTSCTTLTSDKYIRRNASISTFLGEDNHISFVLFISRIAYRISHIAQRISHSVRKIFSRYKWRVPNERSGKKTLRVKIRSKQQFQENVTIYEIHTIYVLQANESQGLAQNFV